MILCTFNTYKIYTVDVLIYTDFRFYSRSANFFVARTYLEPEIPLILLQEKWTNDEVEKSFISTSEKYIFSFVFYGVSSNCLALSLMEESSIYVQLEFMAMLLQSFLWTSYSSGGHFV